MGTLYIDHQGLSLRADGTVLVMSKPGEKPRSIPLSLLERVVVHGDAELSSALIGRMAEANVGLLVLSGRQSWRTASLLGRPHADARLRLAQYQLMIDRPARAAWARLWVQGKLRAQRRFFAEAQSLRPDLLVPLRRGCERVQLALDRLHQAAPDLDTLRGMEGAATAAYFATLHTLFAPALGFNDRNRRPPRDPVNAALSLAYTLLHFEAARAAQAAGLDPMLGLLHDPAYGRESLACDLIEPLRARVDRWVWDLFRERRLRDEHFSRDKGACVLHKAGRRHFYEAWEDAARLFRPPLRGYSRMLTAALRRVPLPLPPAAPDWSEYADSEDDHAAPDRL